MGMKKRRNRPQRLLPIFDGPLRACLYLRVSTGRQAESDLSIPDQSRAGRRYCASKGWPVITEYVEAGASGTDDNRPVFQAMIERATDEGNPFDVLVVHAFSRFFRDAIAMKLYVRHLARSGVRLISTTQILGDDPIAEVIRKIFAVFDEYNSQENGKHTQRAMNENARQGYYNGARLPLGYGLEQVEKRGNRIKKRLVVDPIEADTVESIFRLYRHGDGRSGPLGIKAVACHLNERGYRTRLGARFGVGTIHGISKNRIYIGEWSFNKRCSKTGLEKPKFEHISISVPPIIALAEFEAVQATLKAHNPRVTPARVVTGPILLTGLATCTNCGGAMTLRTGTSKSAQVHRYYACSTHGRQGKTGCVGRNIRMDTLDTLVTDHLVTALLQPERLRATLASLWSLRVERAAEVDGRVAVLRRELSSSEDKLSRLYRMVEEGITDLDDLLKEQIAALKVEWDRAKGALDRIHVAERTPAEIGPDLIERFGHLLRENVRTGEIPFRKAWLQAIVDRVEVGADVIRIVGDKGSLETALTGSGGTAAIGVRSSVRRWRALRESNPCFRRERAISGTCRHSLIRADTH